MSLFNLAMSHDHIKTVKVVGDIAANGTIAVSWAGILSPISTVIAFVYVCIRLYETRTFQQVFKFTKEKLKNVLDLVKQRSR